MSGIGRRAVHEKIVITGMGTVNATGNSVEESWYNVTNGVAGVGPITQFDASDMLVQIACEVKDFEPSRFVSDKEARRRDRFELFANAAAAEALDHSGLNITENNPGRVSAIISTSCGGIISLLEMMEVVRDAGVRRINPFATSMYMPNGAAGMVAIDHGAQGPSFSVSSACASGADGIGIAWSLLRSGVIDAAIAGGSDATITQVTIGALDRAGAMSRRGLDFSNTPQPFDRNRDGFVMGEGAGVVILEREAHARKRGAEILAELAGYGATADAYHITAPMEGGVGSAEAMRRALDSAGLNPEEVDYINAHGTATRLNDATETRAIKTVFGEMAYNFPVSSTKSMTGHMMGATGALEAIFSVLAVRNNLVPPTIHYQTPDPECDLDYAPNIAREHPVRVVLSNAFGFGGHNAVLAIREYQ